MSDQSASDSIIDDEEEATPPQAGVTIAYLGPVAPHWDIRADYGDPDLINAFRSRVNARLMLLPPHDPQFRRNYNRVGNDAERELIEVLWDFGEADPIVS